MLSELPRCSVTGAPGGSCRYVELRAKTIYPLGDDTEHAKKQIGRLIGHSRRTISLHLLTQRNKDIGLRIDAKNENEAKLWAVQPGLSRK